MKSTRGDPKKSGNAGAKSLKIGYRPIRDLEPDPVNPRSHSKKQVRQIAESIRTFGFNVPILVDRHDNIISGHACWPVLNSVWPRSPHTGSGARLHDC